MGVRPPSPTAPLTKGTIVHSLIAATREIWGDDGVQDVSQRLSGEARAATLGPDFTPLGWYPTRHILEWNDAILAGPAGGDERAFRRAVARSIDLGFGRVRRVFLSFATPTLLAERATQLWKHDHTHGVLTLDSSATSTGRAQVALTDHPFTTTSVARIAIAEVFREVLSLSRAKNVVESHAMSGDALVITLSWDA
jgi:hypothetical protein